MEKDDLIQSINKLRKEKDALILAHYYTTADIQDIADYVGDSLALARKAAETNGKIIVMCGVHFMGETAKILCYDRKVVVPDKMAGCSLADSCPPDAFKSFVEAHPDHKVLSYVNTTAAVKAVTDVVVTSGNAVQIVESFPKDEKLIFGPDKNLGNYINSLTGRNMLLWDGSCHVHSQFSVEGLINLKKEHPDALVLVHPECKAPVIALGDIVGSTAKLIKEAEKSNAKEFIVATEWGILHELTKRCPHKTFIPAPPDDNHTCGCSECNFMKLNTLEKVYHCLRDEQPEITVDKEIADKAIIPIRRMLEISQKLGI